jgi:hypothetical protein
MACRSATSNTATNGLAPQRALTSENVGSVVLSTGAGDLGTASTSNLGGTIETYSSAPRSTRNVNVQQNERSPPHSVPGPTPADARLTG